jgi:hypothetical protein
MRVMTNNMVGVVGGIALACAMGMPGSARAFCGFFVANQDGKLSNHASQVALVRQGHRTALTMSNDYQGPPKDFALIVPVPVVLKKEDVKTLPSTVFDHIDALTAPRLVEYWEQDPCHPSMRGDFVLGAIAVDKAEQPRPQKSLGVKIEAKFAVGEYQILILSARDSGGLETWLHQSGYHIPDGASAALAPYVHAQMKFFVAKVDITKVHRNENNTVVLSPLRVSYDADELRLPVRLGLLNASGKQDLIVYTLHPTARFEVANYKNIFIPTNLDVADGVRTAFGSFYAELFDAALANAGGKAIVTEYAWQSTSCDPCPTPVLDASELAILGVDVNQLPGGAMGGVVLTRMHARYDKDTLSDDLIFRQAPAVMGGRAQWNGTSADSGASTQGAYGNNFQGRYIIRHYWQGAITCQTPQYDNWGGPPNGGEPTAVAARNLADAPRGKIALEKMVYSPVPTLGIPAQPHRRQ